MHYTLLNDLLFRKLFTSESNQYILLQFINDMTGLGFKSVVLNETYWIEEYMARLDAHQGELFETVVDLSGELSDGTMISIELQVKNHYKFIERSLYYMANTYMNQYTKQSKYATLNPVISINIINFPLYQFQESTLETFVLKNDANLPLVTTHGKIPFQVIYFSLVHETREALLGYWRKLFLHLEIDDNAPQVIKDANQIIDYHQLSEVEKMIITREEKMRADYEFIRDYELSQREQLGFEQGIEQGLLQTAKKMLSQQFDVLTISEITGLSVADIEQLEV